MLPTPLGSNGPPWRWYGQPGVGPILCVMCLVGAAGRRVCGGVRYRVVPLALGKMGSHDALSTMRA